MTPPASRIFSSYRALGYISNDVPLIVRYVNIRREHLIVTTVGKSFLTFGSKKLRLASISPPHSEDIACIAGDVSHIFTACKNVVHAWIRGNELVHTYTGHEKPVHLLLPFGKHLISVDKESTLKMWNVQSEELYLEMTFSNATFHISTIVHPATYLNKILLGSFQGTLQLWNLRSAKLIYNFKGWGSPISVLEQAPAIDVIAVGLEDGRIIIHNLKYDETVMTFSQEWGTVTSLSFRTDGHPILASSSKQGHIAFWNLEEKKLQSQIRDAHQVSIAGMQFLQNEPLMVTNSADNSLKVWIFDVSDGGGRLLRIRDGHSAPPSKIRFYGKNGENILSAGDDSTLRSFSLINDLLHKSLGQASMNRKAAKRSGMKNDHVKLPPIIDFVSEATREKEWDNIAACHRNTPMVTTWSYGRCKMGELKLHHIDDSRPEHHSVKVTPTCVMITSCGNFVLIGFETGYVDIFNIQSGIYRGHYGNDKAHQGSVCGIATDALNQITVTIGIDKEIKFWKFKTKELIETIKMEVIIAKCLLQRESGLLGMILDDFSLQLLDLDTKRIVRTFEGHTSRITDFDFNQDSRWLVSASLDRTIRVWDIPAGRMVDCFLVDDICTSLTMSPTGEYLATIHVDNIGLYLWVNRSLYVHVSLTPLPSDYEPQLQTLPKIQLSVGSVDEGETDEVLEDSQVFKSPQQISEELVTLSMLPDSRWKNLLVLDIIKKRNKPKEPPKAPKAAPFFLPTVAGLDFKFAPPLDDSSNKKPQSRILSLGSFQMRTEFSKQLEIIQNDSDYVKAMEILKKLGPSAIEIELRSLAPDDGGSQLLLLNFLKMIDHIILTNRDFEVTQAYLGLFLKLHGRTIATDAILCKFAQHLIKTQVEMWERIQNMFSQCHCIVSYLKNASL